MSGSKYVDHDGMAGERSEGFTSCQMTATGAFGLFGGRRNAVVKRRVIVLLFPHQQ